MTGELNIIVARANIVGGVKLEPEQPMDTEGMPGDRLLVKLPFKYQEVSRSEDGFRLQLTSKFAGRQAKPATFDQVDRRGVADDKWGFVSQEYHLPEPGEHVLEWRAAVEYKDGASTTKRDLSGKLTIFVGDPAPSPL